jgi:hypothetical protein
MPPPRTGDALCDRVVAVTIGAICDNSKGAGAAMKRLL